MKKTRYLEHRVVVDTPTFYRALHTESEHAEMMRRSKALAEQVDRHCDGEGKARVEFDVEHYCSHCGYGWEIDDDGLPVCCDKAQAEFLGAVPS